MALRALKLTLEYDGSAFNGYQSNPGARCVQDVLENGIDKLTGEKRRTLFASRTDAGVHARGQVALVRTSSQLECSMFMRNLNTRLPDDLAVTAVEEVHPSFHPQVNVEKKLYSYTVSYGARRPMGRQFRWHVGGSLDVAAMKAAAAAFLGTHDFTSFSHSHRGNVSRASKRAAEKVADRGYSTKSYRLGTGSSAKGAVSELEHESIAIEEGAEPSSGTDSTPFDNVRTVDSIEFDTAEPGVIVLRIQGPSFTHNMVRIIVGTLVEIGSGKRPADCVPGLLAAKDRGLAAPTAPSCGLCLEHIWYAPVDATLCDRVTVEGATERDADTLETSKP